jgi:hypothetical protein
MPPLSKKDQTCSGVVRLATISAVEGSRQIAATQLIVCK